MRFVMFMFIGIGILSHLWSRMISQLGSRTSLHSSDHVSEQTDFWTGFVAHFMTGQHLGTMLQLCPSFPSFHNFLSSLAWILSCKKVFLSRDLLHRLVFTHSSDVTQVISVALKWDLRNNKLITKRNEKFFSQFQHPWLMTKSEWDLTEKRQSYPTFLQIFFGTFEQTVFEASLQTFLSAGLHS